MERLVPEREHPGRVSPDDPVIAFLGKLFAYFAVFVVGSFALLLSAVVIGLAVRIFLIVSGVA